MAVEIAESLNKDVGCVIASLTYELSYMKFMKAVSYLDNPDVIFLGTNTDPVFPVQKGCVLPGKSKHESLKIQTFNSRFYFLIWKL